jgi:hypothetical protein
MPHDQPNVFQLLAALDRGDAGALPGIRDAAPPEAEEALERFLRAAIARADPADDAAATAIEALRKMESALAAPVVAKALTHPNPRVRDAAAEAVGELNYYPALDRLRALRTDAALQAIEKLFQKTFYGGFWADLLGRPRRVEGRRDWAEFDRFWAEEGEDMVCPPLLPDECVPERPIDDFLRRLPGSHRVFERHGFRCVARIGKDMEECVAVTKESLEDAARLHGKPLGPLRDDLVALARRIQAEEAPAEKVDEVETVEPGGQGRADGGA